MKKTKQKGFEGAFIKLPSGRYAKFPSAIKARCGVVDKSLYDTIIASREDLERLEPTQKRGLWQSIVTGQPVSIPKKITSKALWDHLVEHAEDRCAMFNPGKRAVARSNPDGYYVTAEYKCDKTKEVKPITEEWVLSQAYPKQAKQVFIVLWRWCKANETWAMSEDKARSIIETNTDILKTKQSPWRIFQYYRGPLIKHSLLKMGS